MQSKLLREIVNEIAGEFAGDVVDILLAKNDVNEFLIAKKLKLTINQVRNIFYKLSNFGLVSFTRKKDKRKGWYTYFWTLNLGRALELLNERLTKEIEDSQTQLKNRETKRYYLCKECNVEVTEESALLHNFVCPECGTVYVLNADEKIFSVIKSKIARNTKQREGVLEELSQVNEKKRKKIARREKKEQIEKKKVRAEKRAARKKEKEKEERKANKGKKKTKMKKKTSKKPEKSVKKVKKASKKSLKKTSKKSPSKKSIKKTVKDSKKKGGFLGLFK